LTLIAAALCCSLFLQAAVVTVSEGDAKKAAIKKPLPVVSPVARQLNLHGHVELALEIDEQGSVTNVKCVSGNPVLAAGAVTAVKDWKFTPFQDNGTPAKATTTLSFEFVQ
jgi:TonB family protein